MLKTRVGGFMMGLVDGLWVMFMVATMALCSLRKWVELPLDEVLDKFCVFLRSWRMVILARQLGLAIA